MQSPLVWNRLSFTLSSVYHCLFKFNRPSKFRDEGQQGRGTSHQPSGTGTQDPKRNVQGRRPAPAAFVAWDAGNSTGFDADTSKVENNNLINGIM